MFGFTLEKLLVLGAIAAVIVGPQRLPKYAAQLAKFTKSFRELANGAKDRMQQELGPEFQDVDWKKLDPRQYDPRRIIRDALLDDTDARPVVKPVSAGGPQAQSVSVLPDGGRAPFDAEST